MKHILLAILLLGPYLFSYAPGDSSYTDIEIGGGAGQYRYADCQGSTPREYGDLGIKFTHKNDGSFRYGALIDMPLSLDGRNSAYTFPVFYPDLAYDSRYFSLGTTGVRIGSVDQYYFSLGIASKIPLFAGRGFVNMGVGFHPGGPLSEMWIGVNAIPYQSLSLCLNPEFQITDNKFIFLSGRYGQSNGIDEYGLSIGLRVRSR